MATKKSITKKPHCKQPTPAKHKFVAGVSDNRKDFILSNSTKWVNGTEIKFMFLEGATAQKNVVRKAFQIWKNLGIGISFKEVSSPEEAMVRIGFDHSDGSWSYVGREILPISKKKRTMNFGWDLTKDDYGMTTAIHEIGHTIGFQHEHQSPFSGITWDTKAVYTEFSHSPNNWSKSDIDSNILDKLPANQMQGSSWDPKSIMEYQFDAGLILKPSAYKKGINPPGVLSAKDIQGVKSFYPAIKSASISPIKAQRSVAITAGSGDQSDFIFTAPFTKKYTFETSGKLDTVMVIHEKGKKENYYLAGDDDSGLEKNAKITLPLVKGRNYLIHIRVMYSPGKKSGALLVS